MYTSELLPWAMAAVVGTGSAYLPADRMQVHEIRAFAPGTASEFVPENCAFWGDSLSACPPDFLWQTSDTEAARPDIRSASEHLANVRQVFSPAISDLAAAFGVSRQAVYKWLGSESTPEADKLARIKTLSQAADAFQKAGVTHASSVLKMRAFEGRSMLDMVATGQLLPSHVQALIDEAQAMEAAYHRSGLAERRKAPATDDWLSELSIPGSIE